MTQLRSLASFALRRCSTTIAILLMCSGTAAADAVTNWNSFVVGLTFGSGKSPNETGLAAAYMHIAIYDAITAIDGGYRPFATSVTNVPAGASPEAAAAAAAYRVLTQLYPSLAGQITTEYNNALAAIPNVMAKNDGIAVGLAAADGLLALRHFPNDGWNASVPYTFQPLGPGVYQRTPPTFQPAGPVTPWMKQFTPFATLSPSQFRADGPPALTSQQWADDLNEVQAFGALTGSVRTPEQTEIGLFYGLINAAVQIGRNLRNLSIQQQLTLADDARFFAQEYVTMADATVGCWESKYYFNFWRPVTAIQHADIDGNDQTHLDGTWLPQVPTPGHPEYPSAHGCITGAYAHAIAEFFGTKRLALGITLTGAAGHPDRTFDSTDDIIKEIIDARIYNGVHYRTSVVHGSVLSHKVAQWVAKHYFQPVDAHVPHGPKP